LQRHADAAVEGTAIGINIDGGIDRGDFGLDEVFILLEVTFVVRLDVASSFRVQIFVEDVRIVEIPGAGGDREKKQTTMRPAQAAAHAAWARRTRARIESSAPRRAKAMEMTPSTAEIANQ